jgi:hypothetical protein
MQVLKMAAWRNRGFSGSIGRSKTNRVRRMHTLRTPGGILFTFAVFVLIFYVIAFLVKGPDFVEYGLMPGVLGASQIALLLSVVLFAPLAFYKPGRPVARWGFLAAALVFGVAAWILAFLVTYEVWGVVGLLIGIAFAGVGIVAVGIVAALMAGQLSTALTIALLSVCGLVARQIMIVLARRLEAENAPLPVIDLNE